MSSLANKLKAKGLTASDVAVKANLTHSYVSMLLSGRRSNPSAQVMKKLVDASDGAWTVDDFVQASRSAA